MRLIDADAFFSEFGELDIEPYNNAPTVDAVPVIRCKDCRWWRPDKETCIEMDCRVEADGFCAWAERKEE